MPTRHPERNSALVFLCSPTPSPTGPAFSGAPLPAEKVWERKGPPHPHPFQVSPGGRLLSQGGGGWWWGGGLQV